MLDEASEFIDEMSDEAVSSLKNLMGAYILEVANHQFPGVYYWHEEQNQPVFVSGEPSFSIGIIPLSKIGGRLNGDETDNIPFFYNGFVERVKSAKEGEKALYV